MPLLHLYKKYGLQHLIVLLKRLFIVFLMYQLMRVAFYLFNIQHFGEVNFSHLIRMMWGGLRFDLVAILYINSLFLLLSLLPLKLRNKKGYQKFLLYLFLFTNAIGYAFNIMDIFYFDFILKRTTIEVFVFAGEQNIGLLLVQFLKDYWMGIIFWAVSLYITYKYYKTIRILSHEQESRSFSYYLSGSALLLSVAYFSVIGIRGGFTRTTRPINLNHAGAYIDKPLEMAIVLNTPFSIIRTFNKRTFEKKSYFSEPELSQIYTPVKHFETDSTFTRQNVVLIIVESLGREYIGSLNKDINGGNYRGYTPFLDSLIYKSHTFSNAFANGRKSIDALPSIVASVPSLVQPYVSSTYATNEINSMANILKKKSYRTTFFHGAPNGSMGFDAFMNMAGYEAYYGYDEYGNSDDFDGNWGIWDEEFLQFSVRQINKLKEPFLATIFTLTSHHPFKVPKKYKRKFKKGTLPVHTVVQYTDYALRQFFATASKWPWFNNTIFVITADHCNQTDIPEYQTSIGIYAVPLILYQPQKTETARIDTTLTQQADIMPKVLRLLHYKGDFISFGNDVQTEPSPFIVNFTNETWQYLEGDYLLQVRDEKPIALYNYKTDRLLKNNLLGTQPKMTNGMIRKLQAYIQQYYNRLIENRMTLPDNTP